MTSKHKIISTAGKMFLIVLGIMFYFFSILLLKHVVVFWKLSDFIGLIILITIASFILYLGTYSLRKITIDKENEAIIVTYLYLFISEYKFSQIRGYKNYQQNVSSFLFEALFIEFYNGYQLHISKYDLINYNEFEAAIRLISARNDKIEMNKFEYFVQFLMRLDGHFY